MGVHFLKDDLRKALTSSLNRRAETIEDPPEIPIQRMLLSHDRFSSYGSNENHAFLEDLRAQFFPETFLFRAFLGLNIFAECSTLGKLTVSHPLNPEKLS